MTDEQSHQAELTLVDTLLRSEIAHLQELEEKRRMIADGVAALEAPSEMWEQYLEEVDQQIDVAGTRLDQLQRLRDELQAEWATKQ